MWIFTVPLFPACSLVNLSNYVCNTILIKSTEGWSLKLWSQFLQLRKEAWKKNSGLQRGFKSWIFFQASLRNCKNCDHNCEDHSSFDFIFAVHIWFISYASFTYYTHCLHLRFYLFVCKKRFWTDVGSQSNLVLLYFQPTHPAWTPFGVKE